MLKETRLKKGKIYIETTLNYQTLLQYAKHVARYNKININDYLVSIEITQIELPKFADRESIGREKLVKENLIYKSDDIDYTKIQ